MKTVSTLILNVPNDRHVSLGELKETLSHLSGIVRVTVNPVMEKVIVDFYPTKCTVDEIRAAVIADKLDDKNSKLQREDSRQNNHGPPRGRSEYDEGK